ncbi:MAG: hypothetical protein JXA07_14420 [Spirochaetes bacterium]|nr:hypothetical protein [Spirochaetota bacterium]
MAKSVQSPSAWYAMVYLSSALILLGILIFLYSIILDSKKRREEHVRPERYTRRAPVSAQDAPVRENEGRANRSVNAREGAAARTPGGAAGKGKGSGGPTALQAVLFEDSSHIIDYSNESGSIDPTLKGYKHIKRIGSGTLAVEKGGITFSMGKKLYRYDFHRVRDLRPGSRHFALFLHGSKAVKLFIVEPGSGLIGMVDDAYQEYLRSSA